MRSVLVTGGAGFIGRHSLEPLIERGMQVHVTTLLGSQAAPLFGESRHECDLMDPIATKRLLERVRPSDLLHFAWDTTHGKFWTTPANLNWVSASVLLLKSFSECGGARAVFAGTCAEYAWSDQPLIEGRSALIPSTLYGVAKNSLRQIFHSYCAQVGITAAWGRIFFLYGPHEGPNRLVSSAIRALLRGEEFLASHGRQRRDFMHVADVGRAFAQLLASEVTGDVNIASGQEYTLGEVLERIGVILERPELIKLGARPASIEDPDRIVADVQRLQREVGIEPEYSLEAGLNEAVRWWRAHIS